MAIFLAIIAVTMFDWIRISGYNVKPLRPSPKISLQHEQLYKELKADSTDIDWGMMDGALQYIDGQYDCSDFRYVNLMRILHEFKDDIPAGVLERIEKTLFNFRYWWDEPGENSMCYWSENHQILFASAEYLVGQMYPEQIFENSGLTGKQHMEKARIRIMDWLEMRWNYGFIEFNSEVYYKEDIGALMNLIDYAQDEEIVLKCKMIMDLLMYDVAVQNINTMMVSGSGRAYEGNRKGGPNTTLGGVTKYYWGDGSPMHSNMVHGMMYSENYDLPEVLADIARDSSTVIIKQNNGLDLSDLEREGFGKTDNRSMMMQWGMEAFTNPEIIQNSLSHIRQSSMFSNGFVKDFRYLDFTILRILGLEPALSRWLNPQTDGVAIQRGNTYTYRTKNYSLFTVQNYHPGTYGDQQHISGMNINNHFSIFHVHPALEKDVKNQSPNYWVGYGHLPHAVQDKNVSMAIYRIPEEKSMMEKDLLDYTHAYFPIDLFDSTIVEKNYVFGKKEGVYAVFIGANAIEVRDKANDNLVQQGKRTYWITEAGSKEQDGSFDQFYNRIRGNRIDFDPERLSLSYHSNGKEYRVVFGGDFHVNDVPIDTYYKRFDSPYCQAELKPETIHIQFGDKSLYLDFARMKREIRN